MRFSIKVLIAAVLPLSFSACSSRTVHADVGCTNASLSAPYSFLLTGSLLASSGMNVTSRVGRMVFDGQGRIASGTETLNANGLIHRGYLFTGTYSVNSDCTGSLVINPTNGDSPDSFDMVITAGGSVVQLMYSGNIGPSIAGQAYPIQPLVPRIPSR